MDWDGPLDLGILCRPGRQTREILDWGRDVDWGGTPDPQAGFGTRPPQPHPPLSYTPGLRWVDGLSDREHVRFLRRENSPALQTIKGFYVVCSTVTSRSPEPTQRKRNKTCLTVGPSRPVHRRRRGPKDVPSQ